jgi:uncharacterized NAD(P)/FAD-binding protein YdhS
VPEPSAVPFHVVVVGAGFAGTMTTVGLVDQWRCPRPLRVTLLERSGRFGPGVAYATTDDQHLLNVGARKMSALRDQPGQFVAWSGAHDGEFVSRGRYGEYLAHLLADAERRAGPGVVTRRTEEAVAYADGSVHTRGGGHHRADAVVLATGVTAPPRLPGAVDALAGAPGHVADPWAPGGLEALRRPGCSRVLIVGTGLTMVDVALTLSRGDRGPRMLAVSRHGLLPRAHRDGPCPEIAPVARPVDGPWTADALAAHVVAAARGARDWRAAIDSLRPVTHGLWRALPITEQARFARDHARLWEVHRHRMATPVAARVRALRADGRLGVRAATVERVEPLPDRRIAAVLDGRREAFDAVVNATGPDLDVRRGGDPLLTGLLEAGHAAVGPLGLGLRTDRDGALIRPDGREPATVYALGALRRGELWETTAVAEIRCQAADVAAVIAQRAAADAGIGAGARGLEAAV